MTQTFRVVLLAALYLVNCRGASVTQQGGVFASQATLPLLLSLVPDTFSRVAQGADGEDADVEGPDMSPEAIMKDKDNDGFLTMEELLPPDNEEVSAKEREMLSNAF